MRLQKQINQTELAMLLEVTPQAVSKWETGQSLPDASKLPEIAKLFGITIDDIFSE